MCGSRCIYLTTYNGDQPVTQDTGEPIPVVAPRRTLSAEHLAKLSAGRERKKQMVA